MAEAPEPPEAPVTLTEFLDLQTLQELQDSFTGITKLRMTIRDPAGHPLTAPTDAAGRLRSDAILEQLIAPANGRDCDGPVTMPIQVNGRQLGSVSLDCERIAELLPEERAKLAEFFVSQGIDAGQTAAILKATEETFATKRAAAVQSVFLLASLLARLWNQAYQLRERVEELNAINKLSTLLTRYRDVQQVLDAAARLAVEVLDLKSAAIRLLDDSGKELIERSSHNLSPSYLLKGPILLEKSALAKAAFAGEVVYVADMSTDPRVIYPEGADKEGLVSALIAGMVYQGRPIGLLQVYAGKPHKFSRHEVKLLQSLAQIAAAAIEHARLEAHRLEAQSVQRQLMLAADVQRRMLPSAMPHVPPFDIAARYVPSLELGGDFYDLINLDGNLGIAVGDVVGKGIAASLLMASLRASLRAFAQDVYDLDEIVSRVNITLGRDTLPNEFATLFYGVLDPIACRLTFCSAGHDPGLLLRDGKITRLESGGLVLGIDPQQHYDKGLVDLKAGDVLVLHTDGLVDALNFNNESFGRDRIIKAMRDAAQGSAHQVLNHILWEMRRFTGLNHSHDDTTILVVKVGARK